MSLLTQYRAYPQLFLCSVLLLLLGFLGAIFYLYNTDQNQQAHIERYGQIVAASTARQAVDATLNQDLISLQAILQETGQYPFVTGTTLHNIDNKLLVQSGFKPNQAVQGKRYSFTAPVALHNNVAGYLGVTLEVPRRSKQDELFLMCWALAVSLCMLTLWWSIQRQWWSQLRTKIPSAAEMVTAVVDKIPTMAEAETAPINVEKTAPKQVFVRLSVKLININTLHQQLNSESFFTLIQRFEKQLQSLLQLYSGHHQRLSGDMLYVDFSGEEFHECSFRAVCCAQILINMASTSSSPRLQLSATVQPIASTQALNGSALIKEFMTQKSNTLTPAKYEIMVSNSLLDETLQHHCEFELESGKLLHIKPPFSDYVNKQEAQLLQR